MGRVSMSACAGALLCLSGLACDGASRVRQPAAPELASASVRALPSGVTGHIERPEVASAGAPRRVVLVSIDGLAPYVRASTETPTLDRLAREGTSFSNASTIMPSITLPSHTSMLSGVPPEQHQVLWNVYDPARAIQTPTVFTQCRLRGLRCALFAGKEKFVHFAEGEPGVQRYGYQPSAEQVIGEALRYLTEKRPDFVFIHLAEVDAAGHAHGWGSREQRAAIQQVDAALAPLHQLLTDGRVPSTLIVTADHGGHERTHGQDTALDRTIPWIGAGDGLQKLGVTANPRAVSTMDTAATVLALLGVPTPPGLTGRPVAIEPAVLDGRERTR